MPINKGEEFNRRDIFIDHPYESVMFRCDHMSQKVYKRFYGESEIGTPVENGSKLFNDALLYGNEISEEDYLKGKYGKS